MIREKCKLAALLYTKNTYLGSSSSFDFNVGQTQDASRNQDALGPRAVVNVLSLFPFFLPARLCLAAGLGERQPQNGVYSQKKSVAQTPRRQPTLSTLPLRKKESHTCNRGLALWAASKHPQSPSFPLKESSGVGKDRNGIRNKAVLRSV